MGQWRHVAFFHPIPPLTVVPVSLLDLHQSIDQSQSIHYKNRTWGTNSRPKYSVIKKCYAQNEIVDTAHIVCGAGSMCPSVGLSMCHGSSKTGKERLAYLSPKCSATVPLLKEYFSIFIRWAVWLRQLDKWGHRHLSTKILDNFCISRDVLLEVSSVPPLWKALLDNTDAWKSGISLSEELSLSNYHYYDYETSLSI